MPRARPKTWPTSRLVSQLLAWFPSHARDLPWRRTRDPYAIWISEVMLQQTQVKTVIPYWERWLAALPDVATLAAARPDRVLKLWEGLGYYSRARNLQRAAQLIVTHRQGEFPCDLDSLCALPGIGRYTAGALASIAFNQPAPILDGNVIRVLTRLGALRGDPKGRLLNAHLWDLAQQLVSESARSTHAAFTHPNFSGPCSALNQALMELGATICTPRAPLCSDCPLTRFCRARARGRTEDFPEITRRPTATSRRFLVVVLTRGKRFLIHQRAEGDVNAGLWEFPNRELSRSEWPVNARVAAAEWLKLPTDSLHPLPAIKHSITRYRIQLDVFQAPAGRVRPLLASRTRWVTPKELNALTLTSAHRRIARRVTR